MPIHSERPNRRESLYILLAGLVLALLLSLPYALGAWRSSPDLEFSGFIIGQEDGYSYLANMLQGYQGAWLYHLPYTPEPHQGGLFFIFYLLLGKLARLSGLSPLLVFHLSRLLTVPLALLTFDQLVAYFSPQPTVRRLALALFAVGGGFGWLWAILGGPTGLGQMPVDLWVPDASFFLSAFTYPHLVMGQALLFWFIRLTLCYMDGARPRDGLWAALAGLGSSLIHPYTLPVIGVPLGLFALWHSRSGWLALWRAVRRLAFVFLPSLPYLLYTWWFFHTDVAFAAWQAQNLLYSPAPHLYLLGFGLPLVLAVGGLVAHEAEMRPHPFLWIWTLAVPLLLYVPDPLQRRFLDGYQAPLAFLAATGVYLLYRRLRTPSGRVWLTVGLFLPVVLTNVFLFLGALLTIAQPQEPVYRPGWEMSAARWFWHDPTYPVVLSSYTTGNLLPAQAPVRSFVGHGSQTIASAEKISLVARFFSADTPDTWRQELLRRYNMAYVYHGPREEALGTFDPAQWPALRRVYDNGTVQIYSVQRIYTSRKGSEGF